MDNKINHSSQVIFLLGAGASKKAEVPTTYEFVTQFIDHIKEGCDDSVYGEDYDELYILLNIVKILEEWKSRDEEKVDIELLLETLVKIKNREKESLVQIFKIDLDKPIEFDRAINRTIDDLKGFIISKTIIGDEKIGYLKPLRGFLEDEKKRGTPLDIISLNYDICIEQFCNVHKMIYQDGFDLYWNPEVFERGDTNIRLYKLHGSVIWFQSDRENYIKLPIQNQIDEIRLISGEKAKNLMLYPMQKWGYVEPLLELLIKVKYILESELPSDTENPSDKFKFLIAVGYSFRDEHIKKIVWDAARRNRNLYLLIIDPNASQIYERLKYYDEKRSILSSVSGKTICLPYKFEDVFPLLMNKYIDLLKKGLSSKEENQRLEDLAESDKIRWEGCLYHLTKAEFSEMVEDIINTKSISFDKEKPWNKIDLFLPMFVNLSCNKQKDQAIKYMAKFIEAIYQYYKDDFKSSEKDFIGHFEIKDLHQVNFKINNNNQNFYVHMKYISNYLDVHRKMSLEEELSIVNMHQKIDYIIQYFSIYSGQNTNEYKESLKNYIESRKEYSANLSEYFDIDIKIKENLEKIKSRIDKLEQNHKKMQEHIKKSINDESGKTSILQNIQENIIYIEYDLLFNVIDKLIIQE